MNRQQERAIYENLSSPINQLDEFQKSMLKANRNGMSIKNFSIEQTVDYGSGMTGTNAQPARHIMIANERKLWKEDGDREEIDFGSDTGLIVNGKKYVIVGDEWVAK